MNGDLTLDWRRCCWPLVLPLTVGGRRLEERQGFELRLSSTDGRVGHGEASPLPGLHRESLDELHGLLPGALILLREALAPDIDYSGLLSLLGSAEEWMALPASLRFGLEGAALGWLAHSADPADLLGLPVGTPPPSSSLFDGTGETEAPEAATCLKVKVGRQRLEEDVSMVQRVWRSVASSVEIRLDANRAFSLDEALAFAEACNGLSPAWIEEPLSHPAAMPEFATRSGMAVALDESLHEPEHACLLDAPGVAAWVLKPSLLGVGGTLAAFRKAEQVSGRPSCVISSSFEGPCGHGLLETLARCAPGLPSPGLGTQRWFGDGEATPWTVINGRF